MLEVIPAGDEPAPGHMTARSPGLAAHIASDGRNRDEDHSGEAPRRIVGAELIG